MSSIKLSPFNSHLLMSDLNKVETWILLLLFLKYIFCADVAFYQNLSQILWPKSPPGIWIFLSKPLFMIKVLLQLSFYRKNSLGK